MTGLFGYLDEVGNRNDLALIFQAGELLTEDRCRLAADIAVDFVKDETRSAFFLRKERFKDKEQSRLLTAAGALFQRTEGFSDISAEKETHLIDAVGPHFLGLEAHLEAGIGKIEGLDLRGELF